MADTQLEKARELIKAKQYTEARTILAKLNNPTAKKWLTKLDEIAPEPRPAKPRTTPLGILRAVLFSVIILAAVAAIYFAVDAERRRVPNEVRSRLHDYCTDVRTAFDLERDFNTCWNWATTVINESADYDKALACHNLAGALDSPFGDCLVDENILPPGIVRTR